MRELTAEEIRILTEGTFEERVRHARSMTGEEKMLAGFQLFEIECRQMSISLRAEFPWASEPLISKFLRDRLDEQKGNVFFDVPLVVSAG
jgi:hypothetical protein